MDNKKIVIQESCESIEPYAFADNEDLESVSIPSSVRSIGKGAFADCENLRELHLSEGLEEIGSFAFVNTGITRLKLPGSLRFIAESAFDGCPVEEVILPEGLKEVGASAFGSCYALRTVTIPDSLEELDEEAFFLSEKLLRIHASEDWQKRHPGLTGCLLEQLRRNFWDAVADFCHKRNIDLFPDRVWTMPGLEKKDSFDALAEEMERISAMFRRLDNGPPETRILRNAIRCRLCDTEIVSARRHDFVRCRCGACAVDGGTRYLKRVGSEQDYEELAEMELVLDDGLM